MAKKRITIHLRGVVENINGTLITALTNEADRVVGFLGDSPTVNGSYVSGYFEIDPSVADAPVLTTPNGSYTFKRHPTLNIFQCQINGIKAQLTLKKIVGTLTYWA
jgi:hypothetical protein